MMKRLAVALLLAAGCAAPPRLITWNCEKPGTDDYVPVELLDFLGYEADHRFERRSIHVVELIHARHLATRDDGIISPLEFEILSHGPFIRHSTWMKGDFQSKWKEPPGPDAVHRFSTGERPGSPSEIAVEIRPGPWKTDITEADPSPYFGRTVEGKDESGNYGNFPRAWGGGFRYSDRGPLETYMPGRANAWRFSSIAGHGYLYSLQFDSRPEAEAFLKRINAFCKPDCDWKVACDADPSTVTRTVGETTTRGFTIFTSYVVGDVKTTDLIVLFSQETPSVEITKKLEAEMLRISKVRIADQRAGAPRKLQGKWPPRFSKRLGYTSSPQWSGFTNATQILHEAILLEKDHGQESPSYATMLLICAAQLGHPVAMERLIPRLRAGTGMLRPAPELADAWQRKRDALPDPHPAFREAAAAQIQVFVKAVEEYRALSTGGKVLPEELVHVVTGPPGYRERTAEGFRGASGRPWESLLEKRTYSDERNRAAMMSFQPWYGMPVDPWGNDYLYACTPSDGTYTIVSLGRNGDVGGKGPDEDIRWSSRTKGKQQPK
jgi:hypothetical protein